MIELEEAISRLILHEGMKLKPYKCPAGYLTIGVGRNVETNPITAEEKKVVGDWEHGITKNGAKYLLKNDIIKAHKECKRYIEFYKTLDDERQYALLDMCFNLGIYGLLKFRKMLFAMEIGDYRGAAKECLNSKYAKEVGKRAVRIARTIEKGVFSYD
jgi:lysozyme